MSAVQISRKAAVALFAAAGWKDVQSWPDDKLISKFRDVPECLDDDHATSDADEKYALAAFQEASADTVFELTDGVPEVKDSEPEKPKPLGRRAAKKAAAAAAAKAEAAELAAAGLQDGATVEAVEAEVSPTFAEKEAVRKVEKAEEKAAAEVADGSAEKKKKAAVAAVEKKKKAAEREKKAAEKAAAVSVAEPKKRKISWLAAAAQAIRESPNGLDSNLDDLVPRTLEIRGNGVDGTAIWALRVLRNNVRAWLASEE